MVRTLLNELDTVVFTSAGQQARQAKKHNLMHHAGCMSKDKYGIPFRAISLAMNWRSAKVASLIEVLGGCLRALKTAQWYFLGELPTKMSRSWTLEGRRLSRLQLRHCLLEGVFTIVDQSTWTQTLCPHLKGQQTDEVLFIQLHPDLLF